MVIYVHQCFHQDSFDALATMASTCEKVGVVTASWGELPQSKYVDEVAGIESKSGRRIKFKYLFFLKRIQKCLQE